ncbi:MAG: DUF2905 family protein [Candidatus Eisenbacteria bacterium]|nr:DUF2905 family protein [Candidatus Eisenbacteria bacterium]
MGPVLGKLLVIAGIVLIVLGLFFWLGRWPGLGFLGRLPGDLRFGGRGFVIFIPLASSLLISLVLTLLLQIFLRR